MKTIKSILITSFVLILISGFAPSDIQINGWHKTGSKPDSYNTGLDLKVSKTGQKSAFIESIDNNIDGFATIVQACDAKRFLGTTIKMTGYIKSENVAEWAGMWLRIDSKTETETLGFDNMQDRPVTGTSDWTKCEIVMGVSPESGSLKYGALLSGVGKIWFDNVSFEILDNDNRVIPADSTASEFPEKPENLDFEE
jgi:hypothetical protein